MINEKELQASRSIEALTINTKNALVGLEVVHKINIGSGLVGKVAIDSERTLNIIVSDSDAIHSDPFNAWLKKEVRNEKN